MDSWEIFIAAYQAADQEIKDLVDSEIISSCVNKAVTNKNLDESHQIPLVKLYSRFILGVFTEVEMLEEMRKIGIPNSREVLSYLEECKTKYLQISNPELSPTQIPAVPVPVQKVVIQPEINNHPNIVTPTPHIRTMQEDIYSTTQEAILKEGRVGEVHTDEQRWGTQK